MEPLTPEEQAEAEAAWAAYVARHQLQILPPPPHPNLTRWQRFTEWWYAFIRAFRAR